MRRRTFLISSAAALSASAKSSVASTSPVQVEPESLDDGTRYAALRGSRAARSPVLFHFATTDLQSLDAKSFGALPADLSERGWTCISVDVPCHGGDARPNEPPELLGWRYRNDRGESITEAFIEKCSRILDYLISSMQVDPDLVFCSGISRGAFCAFRLAATDSRFAGIAALAPVSDLTALAEFEGVSEPVDKVDPESLKARRILVAIALTDPRVSTDKSISLARSIAASAKPNEAQIEIELKEVAGHVVDPAFVDRASTWLQDSVTSLSNH